MSECPTELLATTQDFFPEAKRMQTEDDVERDEDELEREGLTRASKLRRTSGNQPESEEEEEDEAFEEAGVSRLRSATKGDPMGGIAVGSDGFEDDFMRNPVLEEEDDRVPSGLEEEEELPDVELPLQEDEEEDDEEKDDEEKDDEDEEEPTGLAAVMVDPQARGKKSRTAPADSQLKQVSKARKAPPKGELIIDKVRDSLWSLSSSLALLRALSSPLIYLWLSADPLVLAQL